MQTSHYSQIYIYIRANSFIYCIVIKIHFVKKKKKKKTWIYSNISEQCINEYFEWISISIALESFDRVETRVTGRKPAIRQVYIKDSRIIENEITFLKRIYLKFLLSIIDILLIYGSDVFYLLFLLKIIIKTYKNIIYNKLR